MLGFIEGKVISKSIETSQLVVLCSGVGYEVTLSKPTLEITHVNSSVSLWIYSHVREDAFVLFGFFSEAEKQLFKILIGVSGLGPKIALSLLSQHGPEKLIQLIIHKRSSEISEAAGVGKKLAERLSLELSTKLSKLAWIQSMPQVETSTAPAILSKEEQVREDLTSALSNLGYSIGQIKNTLDRMFLREDTIDLGFEALLRTALKEISGRTVSSSTQESSLV
ncbi:MAG: Holliday junction branch migration protein RuvA [Deltaproteobacteria bacterium]|nr:Holliday junction branch migration protein RuvA [Deltaproteobacteria bacterium]